MAQPYASVADLEARWRVLTASEQAKATVLLSDASAEIRARFAQLGKEPPEDGDDMAKIATCNAVRRAMDVPSDLFGVTQTSQTAGSYSQSFTYSGEAGEMWFKRREWEMMGLGGMSVGSIKPNIGASDD